MSVSFRNRVAIVTGAGNGLGRSHALALAKRGAKVIVNDLGGTRDGAGASLSTAESVVEEIRKAGGEAIADGASVTDERAIAAMVETALGKWSRVDILINNAGILRDKSFVSEDAPSRAILSCAAGGYARAFITETAGVYLPPHRQTPEEIAEHWEKISSKEGLQFYENSAGPNMNFLTKAQAQRS